MEKRIHASSEFETVLHLLAEMDNDEVVEFSKDENDIFRDLVDGVEVSQFSRSYLHKSYLNDRSAAESFWENFAAYPSAKVTISKEVK
jgi:hypothetical protein